jgi:hypothetical protein
MQPYAVGEAFGEDLSSAQYIPMLAEKFLLILEGSLVTPPIGKQPDTRMPPRYLMDLSISVVLYDWISIPKCQKLGNPKRKTTGLGIQL